MKNIFFRLDHFCHKKLISWSSDPRPASYPYISGDGFRQLADHIYDETQTFSADKVEAGDVVFLQTGRLDEYFASVHPGIKNPYKLITHNSDRNIGERELEYLDEKIIRWFAQNAEVKHPKLTPLPIGLENKHYYQNGIPALFDKLRTMKTKKKPRILYGFSVSTNPTERQPALDALRQLDLADEIKDFPTPPDYLARLAGYRFVASPPGNGLDCHRTWEALYLGVVPIVKRSPAMEHFQSIGLPILIIDNWRELKTFTTESLGQIMPLPVANSQDNILNISYWQNLIHF